MSATITNVQYRTILDAVTKSTIEQHKLLWEIHEVLDHLKNSQMIMDQMSDVYKLEKQLKIYKERQAELSNAYVFLSNVRTSFPESDTAVNNINSLITGAAVDFVNTCENLIRSYKAGWGI